MAEAARCGWKMKTLKAATPFGSHLSLSKLHLRSNVFCMVCRSTLAVTDFYQRNGIVDMSVVGVETAAESAHSSLHVLLLLRDPYLCMYVIGIEKELMDGKEVWSRIGNG